MHNKKRTQNKYICLYNKYAIFELAKNSRQMLCQVLSKIPDSGYFFDKFYTVRQFCVKKPLRVPFIRSCGKMTDKFAQWHPRTAPRARLGEEMKQDRMMTLLGVLTAFCGILSLSVGNFIIGGIILLLAFGIFWTRGGGKFNDRSLYEKVVRTDLTIDEIYEKVKDMNTPLGKAWIAEHKGYEGDSIVFGPNIFRDCVVISRMKKDIDIKHITLTDNIIRKEEDEYRFENLVDPDAVEVTPRRYSIFASFKLASVILVRDLLKIIEELSSGGEPEIPAESGIYNFYYYNSTEGWLRNEEGDDVLEVSCSYDPFEAKVMDSDGDVMAEVVPRAFDAKKRVTDSAGYDLYADGEHFAGVKRTIEKNLDVFTITSEAGTFVIRSFPACRRANIAGNYTVELDGREVAVIGGSPGIVFDTVGKSQNDVILSYDDDYLVLYAVMEIFIMTLNKKFLK